jgi:hypothetical protein
VNLAVTEHDHAATLAYASVLQADMDRIQTVFHGEADSVPSFKVGALLCQNEPRSVNLAG